MEDRSGAVSEGTVASTGARAGCRQEERQKELQHNLSSRPVNVRIVGSKPGVDEVELNVLMMVFREDEVHRSRAVSNLGEELVVQGTGIEGDSQMVPWLSWLEQPDLCPGSFHLLLNPLSDKGQ